MKKICAVLLLVGIFMSMLVGCNQSKDDSTSTEPTDGNGGSEIVEKAHTTVRFGYSSILTTSSSDYSIEIFEWDEKGDCVAVTDANISMKHDTGKVILENVYDGNGKLVRTDFKTSTYPVSFSKVYFYDESEKMTYAIYSIPEYMSYGLLVQEIYSYEGDSLSKMSLYVGEELIREDVYDTNGMVVEEKIENNIILTYTYNAFGNVTSATEYGLKDGKQGERLSTRTFQYDENNRLIAYQKKNVDGEVGIEHFYSYDTNGNCVCFQETDERKTEFTYDENGNCVKIAELYYVKTTSNPSYGGSVETGEGTETLLPSQPVGEWRVSNETEFTYDANGNTIAEKGDLSDLPPVEAYRYTYDDQGRIFKQEGLWYRDGETVSTVRTYTYNANGLLAEVSYAILVERLEMKKQTTVTRYTYENGVNTGMIYQVTDENGNVTTYKDCRFQYVLENNIYQLKLSVYDANGNEITLS